MNLKAHRKILKGTTANMNTFVEQSAASSGRGSAAADLDGYSFPPQNYFSAPSDYTEANMDDFGFDPPSSTQAYPKVDSTYSSPSNDSDVAMLAGWPGFERDSDSKPLHTMSGLQCSGLVAAQSLDKTLPQNLAITPSAIARFGQVTPPRSNSATSTDDIKDDPEMSPKAGRRRRIKVQADPHSLPTQNKPKRKRKSTAKVTAEDMTFDSPEDDKRKMSLEKNRVAAAKCRVNKKEKTEQLQKDSHDMAVQNAFLKDAILRMKDEVQHMNALILAHSSCKGCTKPEEIHQHLSQISQDYFSHHMNMNSQPFEQYASIPSLIPQINVEEMPEDGYFAARSTTTRDQSLLNSTALPEYDPSGDFELHTPQPE